MDALYIEETAKTPLVNFDCTSGIFKMSGRSLPEDSLGYYIPIVNWLKEYQSTPQKKTEIEVNLDYFNTSSSKCILDIFRIFAHIHLAGNEVHIKWFYADNDEDMLERGEDFQSIVNLDFNFISYSK